ncbi:MAG: sulfatase-like hydrolase/transferase [Caulobacteraceae bacterium]
MSKSSLSRRTAIATTLGAAGTSLLPGASRAAAATRSRKPNIVYIMADDLGYADVSCYGRREYKTPAIDSLAVNGMRFLQAYANSAVCSATRTALITGRYQYRLACGLEEPIGRRDVGLPPETSTLPSLLKAAGYGTALIGKWHLGSAPKFGPLKSGYDHFYGFYEGASDYFAHDATLMDDAEKAHDPGYMTDLLGQRAVERIGGYAKAGTPFFLSLHFNAPHWPWEGPEDQAESKRVTTQNPGSAAGGGGGLSDYDGGSMKTYAAMVTRMDAAIGKVLKALDQNGVAENTIVIFTSDNGGERYSNTWPFTGKKMELLEGGLRIPAIVRWPGHVARGTTHDQVMISMDWMPTLLAAAGAKSDASLPSDGMNLMPVLTRGAAPVSRSLYWRYLNNIQEAHRSGDWKYLKILGNTFLFNVVDDPLERANWKKRRPEIYDRLVAEYRAWDATMLPLDFKSGTGGATGADLADHFGVTKRTNLGEGGT